LWLHFWKRKLRLSAVMQPPRPEQQPSGESSHPSNPRSDPSNPPVMSAASSPTIPDHDMLRCIGNGSYGEVWLARSATGQWRAVKLVYRDHIKSEREYDREFAGITRFEPISRSHDGFVDILQIGRNEASRWFYYVMELADDVATGRNANSPALRPDLSSPFDPATYKPCTLALALSRQGRLPIANCLQLGLALTAALGHLHRHSLVHRDIKPSNIIFVEGRPKLADVGLVTDTSEAHSVVGTHGFMPPEGPGSVQADLYALGKVLYVASTGHSASDCPNPLTGLADLPDQDEWLELNEVVLKACDPDPNRRYTSAAQMQADLALLQSGRSLHHQRMLEKRFKQAGLAFSVAVVLGLAGLFIQQSRLQIVRERARAAERQTALLNLGNEIRPPHTEGWSGRAWLIASNAARFAFDTNLQSQAAASLAGLDAKCLFQTKGIGGSSVAFDRDSKRVLFGSLPGDTEAPGKAHLLDLTTTNLSAFAVPGFGPVAFLSDGTPVQFSADVSNNLALWCPRPLAGLAHSTNRLPGQAGGPGAHPITVPQLASDQPTPLRFFDLDSGERFISLSALAMTPDGSTVATTGSTAGRSLCAVWEGASGRVLRQFDASAGALALSPDGSLVAAGSDEGEVTIWRISDSAQLPKIPASRVPIHSVAFCRDFVRSPRSPSPDHGWLLAAGDSGGNVTIWEVPAQRLRTRCPGAYYDRNALAFSPDGTLLASAGRGPFTLWDTAIGKLVFSAARGDALAGVSFSPDGMLVGACCRQMFEHARLGAWKLEQRRGVGTLRGLGQRVAKVCLSTDGRFAAAVAFDWQVGIWSLPDHQLLHVFNMPPGLFTADNAGLAFSPDDSLFAFMSGTNAMLFDRASGTLVRNWRLPPGYVDELAFHGSGHLFAFHFESVDVSATTFSRPAIARVRDLFSQQTEASVVERPEFNWQVHGAKWTSDGSIIVIEGVEVERGHTNRLVEAVSPLDRRILWVRHSKESPRSGTHLPLDGAGSFVMFQTEAAAWGLCEAESGNLVRNVSFSPLALNSAAHLFAQLADSASWGLYALNDERLLIRLQSDEGKPSFFPVFSPDGRLFAWGNDDGTVSVCYLEETRRRLRTLKLGW
jgi:WD40 repeat protein